jgi:acyl-coenzyme A thioesterase PaaI-like protein
MKSVLTMYEKLKDLPFGKKLFTFMVCLNAPYFFSIKPKITKLKKNRCEVFIKKKRSVTNHIKTVHAIAMCNMAELSGGLMIEASLPKDKQWIPSGMTVQYLKKAETNLIAVSDGSNIDWNQTGTIIVPVEVKDVNNQIVFRADINMYVKERS